MAPFPYQRNIVPIAKNFVLRDKFSNHVDVEAWLAKFESFNRKLQDDSQDGRKSCEDNVGEWTSSIRLVLVFTEDFSDTLRSQHPWLADFESSSADFKLSLELFSSNPAEMPDVLSHYVQHRRFEIIKQIWFSRWSTVEILGSDEAIQKRIWSSRSDLPSEATQSSLRFLARLCMRIDDDIASSTMPDTQKEPYEDLEESSMVEDLEKSVKEIHWFRESLAAIDNNICWVSLVSRIHEFTNLLGCSGNSGSPFSHLGALRIKIQKTNNEKRETALLAQIDMLERKNEEAQKQIRKQKRIMTNLTYRHLLENLPPREGKLESNAWSDFWKEAVKQTNEGKSTPLTDMVKRYGKIEKDGAHTVDYIKITGAGLYSTLSTNIHHYRRGGSFEYDPDQWNEFDADILKALKPVHAHPNGTVDWELERLRFVDPGRPKLKGIIRGNKQRGWVITPDWDEYLDSPDLDAGERCWPTKEKENDFGIVRTTSREPLELIAKDWMKRAKYEDPNDKTEAPPTFLKSLPPGYMIYERRKTDGPSEYMVFGRAYGAYNSVLDFSEHIWYLFLRRERKDTTRCCCELCDKARGDE